jgi:hypothetical protein
MVQTTRVSLRSSSDTIIAVSTRGILDALLDPVNTTPASSADAFTRSLSPSDGLNEPITANLVEGLQDAAKTALQEANTPRILQAIPTAEYIVRTGFKVDTKLVIKVVPNAAGGSSSDAVSAKAESVTPELTFNQFSLTGINEEDAERYQIKETFEGEVLYLFGRRPRVWTMSGMIVNGKRARVPDNIKDPGKKLEYQRKYDMDFANELWRRWDQYYRGSKTLELRARTYMSYDDVLVEATLLSLVVSRSASSPSVCPASLTFIVHERAFIGQQASEFTDANVAELLQQQKLFDAAKYRPSEILPPNVTSDQLRARQQEAHGVLRDRQAESAKQSQQIDATQSAFADADDVGNQALADLASADANVTAAQDALDTALPGSPEEAQAERDLAQARAGAARAQTQFRTAESNSQKLHDQLTNEQIELGVAMDAEAAARTTLDTITRTLDQQPAPPSDEPGSASPAVQGVLSRTPGAQILSTVVDNTSPGATKTTIIYKDPVGRTRTEVVTLVRPP